MKYNEQTIGTVESSQLAYSVSQVLQIFPVSRGFFYGLIKKNELKTFKVGGKRFVTAKELERFIYQAEANGNAE